MSDTSAQSNVDTILGRLVVEYGLASNDDVQHCIERQRRLIESSRTANQQTLAYLLVEDGLVTEKQIERLKPKIDEQKASQQIPGYRILKKLGHGAMATVYLARQLSLDRLVAIKVLPRRASTNSEFVERFYAEGRAAAKLNHPNIVGAYDVGKAGDYHYFVMEYVEGRTAFDDLTQKGAYAEAEALRIIIQIARALEHAHRQGLIHRDVKPKNIMMTADGVPKLADMGLARAATDREAAEAEEGKAYGTPYYISPEQIRGEVDVDFRADVYGLGATLYHMITGRVPFEGPNPSAVMHRHLKNKLVPPDHVNLDLSAGIADVIEVCMAKDKRQRYASTTDLLADLEAVACGEPPMQARKPFDLATLAALQPAGANGGDGGGAGGGYGQELNDLMPLLRQPAFWFAVTGWATAVLLFVLHVLR
jgi:serine/threonine-protein kinase